MHFPTLNAFLNATAGVFLILGVLAIKRKKEILHKRYMLLALCFSTLFLISYLTYHYLSPGMTKYQGEGFLRILYFTILLTHTPLATLIVPFSIFAVYFALTGSYDKHRKIVRWLFPAWLYVSVTGVAIYVMLYLL